MSVQDNKRQFYRMNLDPPLPAQVFIRRIGSRASTSAYQGWIHNLSGSGCRFEIAADLPVRQRVLVEIHFHFQGRDYRLPAEIRWKLDNLRFSGFHYGAEFVQIRDFVQANLVRGLHELQIAQRKKLQIR